MKLTEWLETNIEQAVIKSVCRKYILDEFARNRYRHIQADSKHVRATNHRAGDAIFICDNIFTHPDQMALTIHRARSLSNPSYLLPAVCNGSILVVCIDREWVEVDMNEWLYTCKIRPLNNTGLPDGYHFCMAEKVNFEPLKNWKKAILSPAITNKKGAQNA
jgi:hypothetical protein